MLDALVSFLVNLPNPAPYILGHREQGMNSKHASERTNTVVARKME
jgi:hypothetical protein